MHFPEPETLQKYGRWVAAGVTLFAIGAVGYRVFNRPRPADEAPEPVAAAAPAQPAPQAGMEGRVSRPARMEQAVAAPRPYAPPREGRAAVPARTVTAHEQTDALREAVVRDTVKTIRLAALRGDEATVKGLTPGLKYQKKLARKVLDEAMREERNPAVLAALDDVMRQVD